LLLRAVARDKAAGQLGSWGARALPQLHVLLCLRRVSVAVRCFLGLS
jgi:hypothetical protein